MNNRMVVLGKWLALAVLILAAGFCYSCGTQEEALLAEEDAGLSAVVSHEAGQSSAAADETAHEKAEQKSAHVEALASETAASEAAAICMVHVCGAVNFPGVYELKSGQRIYEAIELAGGFTEAAAKSYLNLALPVSDGMKIEVPDLEQARILMEQSGDKVGAEVTAANGKSGQEADQPDARINLNTATKAQLMTLSGIGEIRAEDIIRYREEHGPFEQIEDIMKVSGIKDSAFQRIKNDITVQP